MPGVTGLVLTGIAPSLGGTVSIPVTTGALTLTGYVTGGGSVAEPSVGSVSLATAAPTVQIDTPTFPTVGALVASGVASTPAIDDPTPMSVGAVSLTASGLTVSIGNAGTSITNTNATTDVPSNYEICDLTGFRQMPGSMKLTWNKWAVRRKSWESRHPQEGVRSRPGETQKGPKRPEQDDRFIGDEIAAVTVDDL